MMKLSDSILSSFRLTSSSKEFSNLHDQKYQHKAYPGVTAAKKSGVASLSVASLLDQQLHYVIPISIVSYIVLQLLMGMDWLYSANPICTAHKDLNLPSWVTNTALMAASVMVVICVIKLVEVMKLFKTKGRKRNNSIIKMKFLLFTLLLISASSEALAYFTTFGGVCKDAFGVHSNATQWAEWIVTVPLLQYVALAGEQKEHLDRFDVTMLSMLAMMILFGFLLNVPGIPLGAAIVCLMLSCACLLVVTVMTWRFHVHVYSSTHGIKPLHSQLLNFKRTQRKSKLLDDLVLILWYYPTIYFLAMGGALDARVTLASNMLGGMLGKTIYASLLVESQTSMLYEYLISTAGKVQMGGDDGSSLSWEQSKDTQDVAQSHPHNNNSVHSRHSNNSNSLNRAHLLEKIKERENSPRRHADGNNVEAGKVTVQTEDEGKGDLETGHTSASEQQQAGAVVAPC